MLEYKLTGNPNGSVDFISFEPTQELLEDLRKTGEGIASGRNENLYAIGPNERYSAELGLLVMDTSTRRREPVIGLRSTNGLRAFIRTRYTGSQELTMTYLDFLFETEVTPDGRRGRISSRPKPKVGYIPGPIIELV